MNTKTKGIVSYLLITFGGAWIVWGGLWLLGTPVRTSLQFQLLNLPAEFAPAIAAIIVRLWITREGFADAGLRLYLRMKWPYYLFAWIFPLLIVGAIVILATILKIAQADFTFHRAFQFLYPGVPFSSSVLLELALSPFILAIIQTPILWGEEFGWRSYLQIRLLSRRPLLAAVITGLIWGVWHYPFILLGYEQYPNVLVGLLCFPVLTVLLSIILGWLRVSTNSIWSASLAHSAFNSIGGTFTSLLFLGGADFALVGSNGVLAWIPLGIICLWIVFVGKFRGEPVSSASKMVS